MNMLRDTDEDVDISDIDPEAIRERLSLWHHPTFGVWAMVISWILVSAAALIRTFVWPGLPAGAVSPARLVGLFLWGVIVGIGYVWYSVWDLKKYRVAWAVRLATRWPDYLFVGRSVWRWPHMLVMLGFIYALIAPTIVFRELGITALLATASGIFVPNIFAVRAWHPVYELARQIIREVKAQTEGEE